MIEEEKKVKNNDAMKVVGYNMLALFIYIVLCKIGGDEGMTCLIFLIGIHVIGCIITSIITRKLSWLLSAALVLVIGFSTCVSMLSLNLH